MRRLTPLLLPLLFAPVLLAAQTTVTGTVTTMTGAAPVLAHVHLYPLSGQMGTEQISTTEVGKDGKYSVSITDPGFYRLIVTAVNHDPISVPVIAEEGTHTVALDIRPPMLHYNAAPDQVMIIGSWNDFDFQGAQPMKREKDGTYTYTLKTTAKEVQYQLMGVVEGAEQDGRSVNAPVSDRYVYDGGGDYRSILNVKPGTVTIRFNPKDLPTAAGDNEGYVHFTDPVRQKLWDIDLLYTRKTQRFRQAAIAARENNQPFDVAASWSSFKEEMAGLMGEENDPLVRRFAALHAARLLQYSRNPSVSLIDDDMLATIREILPLNSPFWSADPALVTVVAMTGAEDPNSAMLEVVKVNPDRKVQGIALAQVAMTEHYAGNTAKALEYYKTLKAKYSDIEEIDFVLLALNPDKLVQNGKEVPDFNVKLISNSVNASGAHIAEVSKESMKGKYYMIDFWATWCGPCVGEMGALHAAYKKFGGEKFEILSISLDGRVEDVAKFRAGKWAMPWLNAFVAGNFNSDLAKTFEISGIPKPILVDPNGIIIATEGELRGESLEQTLTRYLGDGHASR